METRTLNIMETRTLNIMETRTLNIMETRTLNIMETRTLNIMETRTLNIMETRTAVSTPLARDNVEWLFSVKSKHNFIYIHVYNHIDFSYSNLQLFNILTSKICGIENTKLLCCYFSVKILIIFQNDVEWKNNIILSCQLRNVFSSL